MLHKIICSMTTYELTATIIAIIALIQPWIIPLLKKIFLRGKAIFTPAANLQLSNDYRGAYVRLSGVIEAKHQSIIVRNIRVKFTRGSDGAELCFDWSSLVSPVFQTVGGQPVMTSEIARPLRIGANDLLPVYIEFSKENQKWNEVYAAIFVQGQMILSGKQYQSYDVDNIVKEALSYGAYKEAHDEMLSDLFWKESEYQMELSIEYDNQKEVYNYSFSLDQSDCFELRANIDRVLESPIDTLLQRQLKWLYSAQKKLTKIGEHHANS